MSYIYIYIYESRSRGMDRDTWCCAELYDATAQCMTFGSYYARYGVTAAVQCAMLSRIDFTSPWSFGLCEQLSAT